MTNIRETANELGVKVLIILGLIVLIVADFLGLVKGMNEEGVE